MRLRAPEVRLRRFHGFTLLEVVIAVTILALLTGSIYGLLRQSILAAADLEMAERQDQAIHHFIDLTRSTLESLPSGATLVAEVVEEGSMQQELTLTGVFDAFSMGEDPVSASETVIGLTPDTLPSGDADGLIYAVAITRQDFAPQAEDGEMAIRVGATDDFFAADEEGRYWLPLLPGMSSLLWRFWDEDQELWIESWEDAATRPSMIELQLQPYGRSIPIRVVYDIPPIPELVAETEAAPTATATTNSARGGAGGGGTPDGQGGPGGVGRGNGDGGENRGGGPRPPIPPGATRGEGARGQGPPGGRTPPSNGGGPGRSSAAGGTAPPPSS